jgi:hypothetical protein
MSTIKKRKTEALLEFGKGVSVKTYTEKTKYTAYLGTKIQDRITIY